MEVHPVRKSCILQFYWMVYDSDDLVVSSFSENYLFRLRETLGAHKGFGLRANHDSSAVHSEWGGGYSNVIGELCTHLPILSFENMIPDKIWVLALE